MCLDDSTPNFSVSFLHTFNSPRGIRCVWTCTPRPRAGPRQGLSTPRGELGVFGRRVGFKADARAGGPFNSPRGIRCVWTNKMRIDVREKLHTFNSPRGIRCVWTSESTVYRYLKKATFNSPRGIRCVWTRAKEMEQPDTGALSTPRGELGVFGLRHCISDGARDNSFNSPRGIRCVWTQDWLEAGKIKTIFQLPEGN